MKCKHCSNNSEDGNFCLQTQECSPCIDTRVHSSIPQCFTIRFHDTGDAIMFSQRIQNRYAYTHSLRASNYIVVVDNRYSVDQSLMFLNEVVALYTQGTIDYFCAYTQKPGSKGGTHV